MRPGRGPFWLDRRSGPIRFPSPEYALSEPNGLLAVGGDLQPATLIGAYRQGIFPWYSEGQPILWWTPDPRAVLFPERLHISRSLRKALRQERFEVTLDRSFRGVMAGCAAPRPDQPGTWLLPEMRDAYGALFEMGLAHSAEARLDGRLVGGIYGVAIGRVFFGESMFCRVSNASKVAFVHLVRQLEAWGYALIDCQVASSHLFTLGAEEIPRQRFLGLLDRFCDLPAPRSPWTLEIGQVHG